MIPAALWTAWVLGIFWTTLAPAQKLAGDLASATQLPMIVLVRWTACAALLGALYLWVRPRGPWRWEPHVLGAVAIAAMSLRLRGLATAAAVFWAIYALGGWLLARLRLDAVPPLTRIPLNIAAGTAVWAPILFVLGITKMLYPWLLGLLLVGIIVLGLRQALQLPRDARNLLDSWGSSDELRGVLPGFAMCALTVVLAMTLLMTLPPPIAWDPIHLHLFEARYFLEHHALEPVPGLDYSYFPNGYEAFAAMLMGFGGVPAVQLSTALFFGLILLQCLGLLRQCGAPRAAAVVGMVVAATVPAVQWTFSVSKNDAMLQLLQWGALQCIFLWMSSRRTAWVLAGALMLAAACSVKLTAIFGAIPLAALLLYGAWKDRPRTVAAVLAMLLLLGTYFPLRTYLLTGSPAYPQAAVAAAPVSALPGSETPWPFSILERNAQILWAVHFSAARAFERPLASPLSFAFLFFVPLWWLFPPRWNRALMVSAAFMAAYFLYWANTYPLIRYGLPAGALLFALTGARAAEWFEHAPLVRLPLFAAFVYVLSFGLLGSVYIGLNPAQLRWVSQQSGDETYLGDALSAFRGSQYLIAHAARGDRILSLEYGPNLYTPRDVAISSHAWAANGKPSPALLREAQDSLYRWLVVPRRNKAEFERAVARRGLREAYADEQYVIWEASR